MRIERLTAGRTPALTRCLPRTLPSPHSHPVAQAKTSAHEFQAETLAGEIVSLAKYRGKPMLIENVATL